MTKEEAWDAWMDESDNRDWLYEIDLHAKDAETMFSDGWNMAIGSLKPRIDNIPYNDIIQTMNCLLQRNFKPNAAYKKFIHARWQEGMREEDFERVCIIKAAQWKDDKAMAIYLRPQTLFGTKMDAYLQEPMPKKTKTIMNHLGQLVEVEE